MLMTRLLFFTFTLIIIVLNGAALWTLSSNAQKIEAIVPTALIVSAVISPLALMIAYRIGQVTGVEYLRKMRAEVRAKATAARAPQKVRGTQG